MRKIITLGFALMMVLCSCSETDSSSSEGNLLVSDNMNEGINVDEENMPFGATMTDLNPDDVPISISYENRFMTEEEAKKISDYISAINSCDAELMQNTCYPAYLDYIVEQYENSDVQDYLDDRHETIEVNYTGENFDFNYIIINSLMDENDDDSETGFSYLDSKIYSASPDAEITSRKIVGIDIIYSLENDNGSYSFSARAGSDMLLYIYTIDGQIYIL